MLAGDIGLVSSIAVPSSDHPENDKIWTEDNWLCLSATWYRIIWRFWQELLAMMEM